MYEFFLLSAYLEQLGHASVVDVQPDLKVVSSPGEFACACGTQVHDKVHARKIRVVPDNFIKVSAQIGSAYSAVSMRACAAE